MDVFLECVDDPKERRRYATLKQTLEPLRPLFEGKRVLDFGASHGPAICALLEMGAAEVVGVEPEAEWVRAGHRILAHAGFGPRATLLHVADTRVLPFADGAFDMVLANAVIEHIPQPREAYIRELWRVLADGGYLMVNETPNKYLPKDVHTTGLWFVPWLPAETARRYAVRRGRFPADGHWPSSGWRGLGFREMVDALGSPYTLIPETSRPRHRALTRLGLPASLLDPYPNWLLRKTPRVRAASPASSASITPEPVHAVSA
ncbi:MAG TPA: class I SAM-dependent methyltransferase [Longimicrobiaceae bacterium]|jgi:SAM-dependent methyltransferase|nr:class I SAM-dependent methyltransferase [Longimicrobiaceae bacterium]